MNEKEMEKEFDEKRKEFLANYKKGRTINIVIMAVLMVAYIILLALFSSETWVLYVGFVVIIVLLMYSTIYKKRMNQRLKEYISSFYQSVTEYAWKEAGIEPYEEDFQSQLAQEDVEKALIYTNIGQMKSMNLVRFSIANESFLSADTLIKIRTSNDEKKKSTLKIAFGGKFYQSELQSMSLDANILLYKKGKYDLLVPPNDLKGMELLEETQEDLIYVKGKIPSHIKEVLLAQWKKIVIDESTLDVSLSFHDNRLTVLFSYADKMLTIPLYEPFENMGFSAVARDLAWLKETVEKLEEVSKKN